MSQWVIEQKNLFKITNKKESTQKEPNEPVLSVDVFRGHPCDD